MTGSKTTKEYWSTKMESGIGRSEYTRHIRLYLSVLWECNRCNEHGRILALNSHSGEQSRTKRYSYNGWPVSRLYRTRANTITFISLEQRSLFLREEQTILDCTARSKYVPPISVLIHFCDCGAYLKIPHRETFGLYNDRDKVNLIGFEYLFASNYPSLN